MLELRVQRLNKATASPKDSQEDASFTTIINSFSPAPRNFVEEKKRDVERQ